MILLFFVLNVLDLVTTYLVIEVAGGSEANPLLRWTYGQSGFIGLAAQKMLIASALTVFFVWALEKNPNLVKAVVRVSVVFLSGVVLLNTVTFVYGNL